MKKKVVHIGFPKCASTTLQSYFFGFHPEIYHLGVGVNINKPFPERYLDEELAIAFEMDLRYRKEHLVNYSNLKSIFNKHFEIAEMDQNIKVITASNELLSFTFSHDIDITQKARRLRELFSSNTEILVVVRNQFDLIKSMYSEYIKCGSYLTFDEFIESSFLHDYKFFISDILYDKSIGLYADLFGIENIHVILFEDFVSEVNEGINSICRKLNISENVVTVGHKNASLKQESLAELLQFNYYNRNNLGNSIHEGAQMQRLYPFLRKEKEGNISKKILDDHRLRKEIIQIDQNLDKFLKKKNKPVNWLKSKIARGKTFQRQNIEFSVKQKDMILEYYKESNMKFAQMFNLKLEKYNYPL